MAWIQCVKSFLHPSLKSALHSFLSDHNYFFLVTVCRNHAVINHYLTHLPIQNNHSNSTTNHYISTAASNHINITPNHTTTTSIHTTTTPIHTTTSIHATTTPIHTTTSIHATTTPIHTTTSIHATTTPIHTTTSIHATTKTPNVITTTPHRTLLSLGGMCQPPSHRNTTMLQHVSSIVTKLKSMVTT